jgi:hypothetical protein
VGTPVAVALEARNDGDTELLSAQLTVTAAQGTVSPSTASFAIAAGKSVRQTITVTPQTAGAPVQLTVTLSGMSAFSGRSFAAQPASAASGPARRPPALSIAATPSQSRASTGQKVPLAVQISNSGEVDVQAAVLSISAGGSGRVLDASGYAAASVQLPPATVPAGGSIALSAVAWAPRPSLLHSRSRRQARTRFRTRRSRPRERPGSTSRHPPRWPFPSPGRRAW